MNINTRVQIIGVQSNQGKLDNGVAYDYTRVIALAPLSGDKNLGFSSVVYDYGQSGNFEKFKGLKFPFAADVECLISTTGKVQKIELVSFTPVPSPSCPC